MIYDKDLQELRANESRENEKLLKTNRLLAVSCSGLFLTVILIFTSGYTFYTLISVWLAVVIVWIPKTKETKFNEITQAQYYNLKEIQRRYKLIGYAIGDTLKKRRLITQYEYELVMDMVEQEETNFLKRSMENI